MKTNLLRKARSKVSLYYTPSDKIYTVEVDFFGYPRSPKDIGGKDMAMKYYRKTIVAFAKWYSGNKQRKRVKML